MKSLFNCSVIKNVYLRLDMSPIELEITYTDDKNKTWISREKKADYINLIEEQKERYRKAYNDIKQALLKGEKYVEVEL